MTIFCPVEVATSHTRVLPCRLEIHVRGTPQPQPRPRTRVVALPGRKPFAQIYTPGPSKRGGASVQDWRAAVLLAARQTPGYPAEPWTGAVRVSIQAFFERPKSLPKRSPQGTIRKNSKPDADNLVKSVLDALTPPRAKRAVKDESVRAQMRRGYLWVDDAQVHLGPVDRWYAAVGCAAGVIIQAELIDEEQPA